MIQNLNASSGTPRTYRLLFYGEIFVGLYATTYVNYLLFHSLAEIFSIVVAFSFFTIAWNSKAFIQNQYLLFVGVAYFFIAFLDLMHTLSYSDKRRTTIFNSHFSLFNIRGTALPFNRNHPYGRQGDFDFAGRRPTLIFRDAESEQRFRQDYFRRNRQIASAILRCPSEYGERRPS